MRDEIITQNLDRLMKREVIKQQCWDAMIVKGRCIEVISFVNISTELFDFIQTITNPNRKQSTAPIVVENYPLVPRSLEELENIRQIIERRRIEIAERKLRRQILIETSPGHEPGSEMPSVSQSFLPFSRFKSLFLA